jgi:hypothetical protein
VWLGAPGAIQLVARKGSPAPGIPPEVTFFTVPNFPSLNNAGQVAFDALLITFEAGIWNGAPGAVELVARQTTPAPGTPPGVNFSLFLRPAINDAGQVVPSLTGMM